MADEIETYLRSTQALPPYATIVRLIDRCQQEKAYAAGRKLLERCRLEQPDDHAIWVGQQLALCTYQDEELPTGDRLDRAVAILDQVGLRTKTAAPETLRLGGAVYKRKWEYDGQIEHLYQSLGFYRRAYENDPGEDKGYGGANAAYILDLLASRARAAGRRSGSDLVEATALANEARRLRESMVEQLRDLFAANGELKNDYWFVSALAEAHFGLGHLDPVHYQRAAVELARARTLKPIEWQLQTTCRQLVALARLQGVELPIEGSSQSDWHPAWRALACLLGEDTDRALSCYRGKVGLALSGGGFRASLFHLGVLARLAAR